MVTLHERDMMKSTVEATIEATTVSTGKDARDKHLKSSDFFDVAKNPTLNVKSTSMTNSGGKLQLIGDLTLGGVASKDGKVRSGFPATGILNGWTSTSDRSSTALY